MRVTFNVEIETACGPRTFVLGGDFVPGCRGEGVGSYYGPTPDEEPFFHLEDCSVEVDGQLVELAHIPAFVRELDLDELAAREHFDGGWE